MHDWAITSSNLHHPFYPPGAKLWGPAPTQESREHAEDLCKYQAEEVLTRVTVLHDKDAAVGDEAFRAPAA